jgi:hypothetical protein
LIQKPELMIQYKASVWAVVMDQQAEEEEAQQARLAKQNDSNEWSGNYA